MESAVGVVWKLLIVKWCGFFWKSRFVDGKVSVHCFIGKVLSFQKRPDRRLKLWQKMEVGCGDYIPRIWEAWEVGSYESQQNVLVAILFSLYVTNHAWFQPQLTVAEEALCVFLVGIFFSFPNWPFQTFTSCLIPTWSASLSPPLNKKMNSLVSQMVIAYLLNVRHLAKDVVPDYEEWTILTKLLTLICANLFKYVSIHSTPLLCWGRDG